MEQKKNTDARIAANNRYNAKAYDKVTVSLPKGTKDAIQAAGNTINGYINKLIADDMAQAKRKQR